MPDIYQNDIGNYVCYIYVLGAVMGHSHDADWGDGGLLSLGTLGTWSGILGRFPR